MHINVNNGGLYDMKSEPRISTVQVASSITAVCYSLSFLPFPFDYRRIIEVTHSCKKLNTAKNTNKTKAEYSLMS